MRRIAVAALLLAALAGAYWACSSDAPVPTPPTKGPQGSALVIALFTTDANPTAGSCTLIQAVVTLNGKAVDDGTGVFFSTDFGFFGQNNQPNVSIVTQKGSAIALLCSNSTGTAFVNASATVSGLTAKGGPLKIVFQPSAAQVPFFSNCSPNFGPNTGGTALTINGGRFPGSASSTRATFTAAGVTREALVTAVTSTAVTLTTPAFPEATSPSVPVTINLMFGSITLTIPNCFAFGTASATTPTLTAVLPSSGSKDGNTRVSIIGSGFSAPLQVFFSTVEAQVLSVTFNQIVVLTPPAFLFGSSPPINTPLDVRVREVNCPGPTTPCDGTLAAAFTYVLPIQITAIDPLQMRIDSRRPLTIFGHGFQAPISVQVAGVPASVMSVSDSEVLVLPGLPANCAGPSGSVTVTNISTGESASSGQSFTYIATPISGSISPNVGAAGTAVTITGTNLPTIITAADVRFGGQPASVTSVSSDGTSMVVTAPSGVVTAAPQCGPGDPGGTLLPVPPPVPVVVKNLGSGCSANVGSFTYALPCIAPTPTPTPTP